MQTLTTAFGGTAQPVPGNGTVETPATGSGRNAQPALSWPVTIWYLEDGFETVVPADKRARYTGREPNRQLIQAVAPKLRSSVAVPDQASQLKDAVELAYCQPAVGAFFNFQFVDEVGPRRLAVGPALGRRHAEAVVRAGEGALRVGRCRTVDCARFPFAATGPRTAAPTDDRGLASALGARSRPVSGRRFRFYPRRRAARSRLRRRFHPRPSRARPRPGRLPARSGSATGSTSTPPATSKRAPPPSRR